MYRLLALSSLLAAVARGWLRKTPHLGYVFQIGCQKKVLVLQLHQRVVREPLDANEFCKASLFLPPAFPQTDQSCLQKRKEMYCTLSLRLEYTTML